MALELTTENFEKEVLQSDKLVMVDFYATWCGPCKMMAPIVEDLSKEYEGKAVIAKLDTDDAIGIAQKYRIMSIPSFVFFKDGEAVKSIRGSMSKAELKEILDSLM